MIRMIRIGALRSLAEGFLPNFPGLKTIPSDEKLLLIVDEAKASAATSTDEEVYLICRGVMNAMRALHRKAA